jgi:hypothetical protein
MRALMRAVPFLLLAASAVAQEPPPAPDLARPQPAPAAAPEPTPAPAARPPEPSLTNVRIDLTLTDQSGSRPAVKKTIALTLADGERGAVRSRPQVAVPMAPGASQKTFHVLPLNVDARPRLVSGRINLFLTIEYSSIDQQPSAGDAPRADVNFSGQVLLDSGRPMVVAEAADPVSDRRVTVEVKATVLK